MNLFINMDRLVGYPYKCKTNGFLYTMQREEGDPTFYERGFDHGLYRIVLNASVASRSEKKLTSWQ